MPEAGEGLLKWAGRASLTIALILLIIGAVTGTEAWVAGIGFLIVGVFATGIIPPS